MNSTPRPAPPAEPGTTALAAAPPSVAANRTARAARLWPWLVCVLLLFATLISYLDRQSFSVVGPVVRDDLRIDNEKLGMVLSAFYLSYGLMHLFVGWFLDRFNIRITYAIFVALWSLAQMATGLSRTFGGLYACRFALGVFEAAGQTGAARIISRIIPQKDRTLANSIMMSGGSLGAILAPPMMIWLNHTVGWRAGFAILGGIGLVWVGVWLAWFRPPAEVVAGSTTASRTAARADQWGAILRDRRFWGCVAGAAFGIPIIHISGAWLPTYFVQTWGLSLNTDLALYLILIYVGADVSLLSTGVIISLLTRRGIPPGRAKKYVLLVAGLLMATVGFVAAAPTVMIAVLLVLALNVGRMAFGSIFLSFNQEIAPGRVATIAGIMGAIGAFSGSFMVYLIGVLSEHGGFALPFALVAGLGVLGTIALLVTDWDTPVARQQETPA